MRKYYSLIIPALLGGILVLSSGFGGGDLKSSSGAPPGYTNSPSDAKNCSHCMGGTATPVSGWITSTIPASGFVMGETYNIIVSATGTLRKGFELSPQDPAGNLIGTLNPLGNTKLAGFGKYITHTTPSTANPTIWVFEWTAPTAVTGDVVFYASIALGQLDTRVTTFTASPGSLGIDGHEFRILSVYPNPVRDGLNIDFILPAEEPFLAELLSLTGKKTSGLISEKLPAGLYSKHFVIDMPAGIYILRLKAGNIEISRKIVII